MRMFLFLIVLNTMTLTLLADFEFKGKIIAYNGSPPALANVSYRDSNDSTHIEQADKDGNYSIKVKDDIIVELLFTAVNHYSLKQTFPIPSGKDFLQVNMKLLPFKKLSNIKDVSIRGNFNDFRNETAKKMIKNDNGAYTFKIKHSTDTLLYLLYPEFNDRKVDYIFNGTQSDFYLYQDKSIYKNQNGGDYISGIINKDREFNIVFNPDSFPKGYFKSDVTFMDESFTKEYDIYKQICRENIDNQTDRADLKGDKSILKEEKKAKSNEIKKYYLKNIENLINEINIKELRYLSIMEYLAVAHDGGNMEGLENELNKKIISEIYNVSPDSKLWNKVSNYYSLVFIEALFGKINNPEYIFKVLNSNHPSNTKAGILGILVQYCSYKQLQDLKDKYYEILQNEYPDTKEAERSKFQFGKDRAIQIGKDIPPFSLKNLNNETEIITPKTLAGKYVLLVFWGTWCPTCKKELPNLIRIFEKFKDKNFTIYSIAIDKSDITVKNFLKNYLKMSWLHSYAGEWGCEIANKFEVVAVPKPILIDPQGKIIALEGLKGEKLMETLEKYVK